MSSPFVLVVADIHLQATPKHAINQRFLTFLNTLATQAEALYILGDLFETWVGDDIGITDYRLEIEALIRLRKAGTAVYLQYGNRDFLMGKHFFEKTGITLLPEISSVQLFEQTYLFCHGDQLCTDDKSYQRMRKFLHNRLVQWLFLKLSKSRRIAMANRMRAHSKYSGQQKSQSIMDVNEHAIESCWQQYPSITHLIHGHTHRPGHHQSKYNHITRHRWVLGDWRPDTQIISINAQGPELIYWPV